MNPSVLRETVTPGSPLSTVDSLSLDPKPELISCAELSAATPTSVPANVDNFVVAGPAMSASARRSVPMPIPMLLLSGAGIS
mmetsp:Transcript_133323/g.426318  ORF Transcript_133323/g.426318 Transcript_133323/m.426318 type:complete len:82 (-) Transcript_133323:1327-1572(-)